MTPTIHKLINFGDLDRLVRKAELHFQKVSVDQPFVVYADPAKLLELRLLEARISQMLARINLDLSVDLVRNLSLPELPSGDWSGVVVGSRQQFWGRQLPVENFIFEFG